MNSGKNDNIAANKKGQNDVISLKHIFLIMLNKIWLIILLLVVGAAVAFSYAKFMLPLKYQSYTSMYVKSVTQTTTDSGNVNNSANITAARSLVSTYIAVLQDDAVMDELSSELIKDYGIDRVSEVFYVKDNAVSADTLRSCITMAAVDETEVLKITAVTTDAEMSAAVCSTLAEIAPDFLIRVVGAGSVEEIGSAKINENPVSPDIPKLTLYGALIGLVIAVAIILLIDFCDNTVKDTTKLTEIYDKAIIGEVQDFNVNNKRVKKEQKHFVSRTLLTDKGTPFYVIESYKSMRTNIVFALSSSDKKVFAVSSSGAGDGKSTNATNIAIALSQADNKVLLIDGDMRKPVIHKTFKLKNKKGLSSAISKMEKVEDCVSKEVIKNLDVMTSGPKPPNPSELLASSQMNKILDKFSLEYDYVVIDTPPVNVVSDAMGLSKSIAGILLVLRYGKTTFDEIDDSMKKINLADMNMLGFILNDINWKNRATSHFTYRYGYSKNGYGYGYAAAAPDYTTDEKSDETETEEV
jgi:capsular exopolysaccharide synthesis family protein